MDEVLDPFYIFLCLAVAVFLWEGYDVYAYMLIGISVLQIIF